MRTIEHLKPSCVLFSKVNKLGVVLTSRTGHGVEEYSYVPGLSFQFLFTVSVTH